MKNPFEPSIPRWNDIFEKFTLEEEEEDVELGTDHDIDVENCPDETKGPKVRDRVDVGKEGACEEDHKHCWSSGTNCNELNTSEPNNDQRNPKVDSEDSVHVSPNTLRTINSDVLQCPGNQGVPFSRILLEIVQ